MAFGSVILKPEGGAFGLAGRLRPAGGGPVVVAAATPANMDRDVFVNVH